MSHKMAARCGQFLLHNHRKRTRRPGHVSRKWCRSADKATIRLPGTIQSCEERSCFSHSRTSIHVTPATPRGTIPTSRFSPSQGDATIRRRAIQLNVPLAKIHPAWRPIGGHNERVSMRVSARIHPIRNNVANAPSIIIGSPKSTKGSLMDWKPEVHVTIAGSRSDPFKKCTAAKSADTASTDTSLRPVRSKMPRTIPRKNVSSMNGTLIAARTTLPRRGQTKTCRNE